MVLTKFVAAGIVGLAVFVSACGDKAPTVSGPTQPVLINICEEKNTNVSDNNNVGNVNNCNKAPVKAEPDLE